MLCGAEAGRLWAAEAGDASSCKGGQASGVYLGMLRMLAVGASCLEGPFGDSRLEVLPGSGVPAALHFPHITSQMSAKSRRDSIPERDGADRMEVGGRKGPCCPLPDCPAGLLDTWTQCRSVLGLWLRSAVSPLLFLPDAVIILPRLAHG